MELCIQGCAHACKNKDLDAKLPYRQMAGTISVIIGLLDLISDVAVVVYWYLTSNYSWAGLMTLSILITNLWSMYKYTNQISPRKWTALMSIFGLLNVRILTRFWGQLDQEGHYRKLMDARFVEALLESIPCAILQIYSIVLTHEEDIIGESIVITSCFISLVNLAYGLRNWYKFSVVAGDSLDFEAETKFELWYLWLEIFVFFDFIVRAGSLALFLSVEDYRPLSLGVAPLALYLIEFMLDVWDNKAARRDGLWFAVITRAFSDALVSLGSGFMFLLFAARRRVTLFEIITRYGISIALFILFVFDLNDKDTDTKNDIRFGWEYIFPVAFFIAVMTIGLMTYGKSSKLTFAKSSSDMYDDEQEP